MTRNAFLNASGAFVYITAVVSLLFCGFNADGEGILFPITMLSLFVLSILMMCYTLLLAPLVLFFEKEVKAGTVLFVKTLAYFALLTGACVVCVLVLF